MNEGYHTENNYAIVYVPNISYMATDNAEITPSVALFDGKGNNIFANLKTIIWWCLNWNIVSNYSYRFKI